MIDYPTTTYFKKTDIVTGEEVSGAKLEIYADDGECNATGEALYSWTSNGTPHLIERIPIGKYVLVEKTAPTDHGG